MSEVDATLAGGKSPDYWVGYRKCLDDLKEDEDYEAIAKRDQRIDRLVTLAAAYVAGNCARSTQPDESVMLQDATNYAVAQLAAIEAAVTKGY